MASFVEELWNSIFTPGPTPTLLVATNASFAALQLLLLILLIATRSLHFLALSIISGGLWYSINWFVRELGAEKAKTEAQAAQRSKKEKSPEFGSDTETEAPPPLTKRKPTATSISEAAPLIPQPAPTALTETSSSSAFLRPQNTDPVEDALRRRRSLGDSSGDVSTDSDWEKISGDDDKAK